MNPSIISCPDQVTYQAKLGAMLSIIEKFMCLNEMTAKWIYQNLDERLNRIESDFIPGRVRAVDAMAVLRIGKTTFYERVKDGTYPALRRDGRMSYWTEKEFKKVVQHEHN